MVTNILNKVKKFLPFIGIALLLYVIYTLNVQKLIDALRSINPLFILAALALNLPQLLIRNSVWQLILKEHKIHVGYLASLKIFLIGFFYGSFTPAYSGQVMRLPYLKERTGEPYGKLFFNLAIETTLHTISLYCMMFVGAILVFTQLPQVLYFVIGWSLFVAIVILYFMKKERGQRFFNVLIKYLAPEKLKVYLTSFADTFYADFPRIKTLLVPMLLGVFTWLIVFTQEYIVALALGLSIPYLLFLVLYPVASTVGFIPVTFAGLGTRELTAIFIFTNLFLVPRETVFVLSIVGFVITDAFCGFLGFLLSLTETRTKETFSDVL